MLWFPLFCRFPTGPHSEQWGCSSLCASLASFWGQMPRYQMLAFLAIRADLQVCGIFFDKFFSYCYFHASIRVWFTSSLFLSLPENSDITVVCSTEYMDLSIYLCPVYQALYNESLMVLNNQFNTPECFGAADWSVDPPVLKFRFPLNESSISSCKNNFKVFFTLALTIISI